MNLNSNPTRFSEEQIGKLILDSAFKVHTKFGPGLLESVYESALTIELMKLELKVERQKSIPIEYDGHLLEVAFRADLIVNDLVLVKLKSVEAITPLFKKTVTNYLKLIPLRLGFLINFNETQFKNGIIRVVNGLEGKSFFKGTNSRLNVDLANSSPSSRSSRDTQS
jgi:GxxExxY protein